MVSSTHNTLDRGLLNMMSFYKYIYYKIYRSMERMGVWPEVRAYFLLLMLNAALILLVINYYTIVTGKRISLPDGNTWIYILSLFLAFLNYVLILHNEKWRLIIYEFNKLPKKKNKIGTLVVWCVILIITFTLFSSFFRLSQINY